MKAEEFLTNYDDRVISLALKLRQLLLTNLPEITEQVDIPAKMIAYCYGQKYIDLICVIIPSKKGLKLGFNRGTELNDPQKLLEGNGKISRYVPIFSEEQICSIAIKDLLIEALNLYQRKLSIKK
jgi:hypothetical protein